MRRHLVSAAILAACVSMCVDAAQANWIFFPSRYSHSPLTGQRVDQYAPHRPAYTISDGTYRQSAYRHTRSSIRVGTSADRLHIVEEWGAGAAIRPYGEWQRPFRAGATPYGPWGNPQGPWTLPFESWYNPFALGTLPIPPWLHAIYPPDQAQPPAAGHPGGAGGGKPGHGGGFGKPGYGGPAHGGAGAGGTGAGPGGHLP